VGVAPLQLRNNAYSLTLLCNSLAVDNQHMQALQFKHVHIECVRSSVCNDCSTGILGACVHQVLQLRLLHVLLLPKTDARGFALKSCATHACLRHHQQLWVHLIKCKIDLMLCGQRLINCNQVKFCMHNAHCTWNL